MGFQDIIGVGLRSEPTVKNIEDTAFHDVYGDYGFI